MTDQKVSYQNIFQRYELKYLVSGEQKKHLLDAMADCIEPDEYGRSLICSLYFDTPDYLLARRSLEHPVYKEKLRVRSYGAAADDSTVFIELKKKYQGVVYKRRVSAGQREAMEYLCGNAQNGRILTGIPDGKSEADGRMRGRNQIVREIDYFLRMYSGLSPAVYLSYEREAFRGVKDPGLRITFDENILWRERELSLCAEPYGTPLLDPGCTLLEVKLAGAMPVRLCRLLSENGIFPGGFSKYGNAYRQITENLRTARKTDAKAAGGTKTKITTEFTAGGRKYA